MALQKLCALLQQVMIGRQWGVGERTDAFFVAQIIPLLLGGQLCASVTSALVASSDGRGPLECGRTAAASVGILGCVTALAAALGLGSEAAVHVLAGGLSSRAQIDCVHLMVLMLPLLPLQACSAILTAQALASSRFLRAAVAGWCVPLGGAVGALVSGHVGFDAVVLGTVGGAGCQLVLLLLSLRYVKPIRPVWETQYCLGVIKRGLAIFLSLSVGNGYVLVDRWMAGRGSPGEVAAVAFACNVVSVPGSLIVTAISNAVLPTLTRSRDVINEFSSHGVMALKLSLCLWIPSAMAFVLAKPLILAVLFSRHTSATAGPTAALLTMYLPAFLGLCVRDTFAMIAVAMDRAGQAAQIGIAGVLLSLLTKVFVLHPFSLGRCAMITGCFSLAVALATAVAVGRGGGLKWRKGPVWTLKLSVVSALAVGIGIVATPVIGGGPSVALPFVAAFLVFCVGCAVTGILPLRHLLAKVCLGA